MYRSQPSICQTPKGDAAGVGLGVGRGVDVGCGVLVTTGVAVAVAAEDNKIFGAVVPPGTVSSGAPPTHPTTNNAANTVPAKHIQDPAIITISDLSRDFVRS